VIDASVSLIYGYGSPEPTPYGKAEDCQKEESLGEDNSQKV